MENTEFFASQLNKIRLRKKRWKKILIVLSCIVVFVTTYALILPAITLEGQSIDFEPYIQSVTVQYRQGEWQNWQTLGKGDNISPWGSLRFNIYYVLPGNTLSDDTRTIVYHFPSELQIMEEESGIMIDSAGREVGTYTIKKDGTVEAVFYDEYVKENSASGSGKSISGQIEFLSDASQLQGRQGEVVVLPFTDEIKIGIQVGKPNDLSIGKSSAAGKENGTVDYTITINSKNGTSDVVNLTDTMSNVTVKGGTFVIKDKNGNAVENIKVPNDGASNFNLTLPKMNAGDKYTITYTAKASNIDKDAQNVRVNATNSVIASSKDPNGNEIADKADTGIVITVNPTNPDPDPPTPPTPTISLSKQGKNIGNNLIEWTITVGGKGLSLEGYTLSDTFNGTEFKGEAEISPAVNGKSKITFPFVFPKGSSGIYTIKYTTSNDKAIAANNTENRADLDDGKGDHKTIKSYENWGRPYNPLSKNSAGITIADNNIGKIKWDVVINADQGPIEGPWTYEDSLGDNQYFTKSQLDALEKILKNKGLSFTMERTGNGSSNYSGYKIVFNKTLQRGEKIAFSYNSTAVIDPDATDNQIFKNNSNINKKVYASGSETVKPFKPSITKFDAANQGTNDTTHEYVKNGVIKWGFRIYVPETYENEITVTEKLPQSITLTDGDGLQVEGKNVFALKNFIFKNGSAALNINGSNLTATIQNDGSILIKIPSELIKQMQGNSIVFYVNAVLKDDIKWEEKDSSKLVTVLNNSVVLSDQNGTLSQDEHNQTIVNDLSKGVVSKSCPSADQIKSNVIPYTVVVNADGRDLHPDSDTINFVDVLTITNNYNNSSRDISHATLVPDSVKVYEMNSDGTKGEPLLVDEYPFTHTFATTKEQYNNIYHETNTLEMSLPDGRPLIVEYKYLIRGTEGGKPVISNTAIVKGSVNDGGVSSETKLQLTISSSSATANINETTISKVDADNFNIHLQGAQFKLWRYISNTDEWVVVKNDDNTDLFTTDDKGELSIKLAYNTAYRLQEVTAPVGYELDDRVFLFKVNNHDLTNYPESIPKDFNGEEFESGAIIYYPNKKTTTDITVAKKWFDADNNKITNSKEGSIDFKLFRKLTVIKEGGVPVADAFLKGIIRYQSEQDWAPVFKEFNEAKPSGTKVTMVITSRDGNKYYDPGAPTIKINGVKLTPETYVNSDDSNFYRRYTFKFTLNSGDNIISGCTSTNAPDKYTFEMTFEEPVGTSDPDVPKIEIPEFEYVDTYSITSDDGWKTKLSGLPKDKEYDDGTVVKYDYYVEEISVPGYVITYDNNNGIEYGVVTISNTAEVKTDFVLPETGGFGTHLFTLGGVVLITLCLLYGCIRARKRERRFD